jgi:hypothetical protein
VRFCSEDFFAKEYLEVFRNEDDISRARFAALRFLERVPVDQTSDFLSPFCKYDPRVIL